MNFLISILFLFQDGFRGRSGTMDDVPAGLNYWLFTNVILPGGAIFIVFYLYVLATRNSRKEKEERKRKNEESRYEEVKDGEELKRLKNLDEYEETDCFDWNGIFYLNINEVKKQFQAQQENVNKAINSLSRNEFEHMASQMFPLDKNLNPIDTYKSSATKYLLDGTVNIRNSEGMVTCKEFFIAGEKSLRTYYDKNGKEKQGCWQGEYDNGQLSVERFYLNGNKHGVQKSWHENGQLSYECNYTYGLKQEVEKFWHENGQLNYEQHYKDGKKHGYYRLYKNNGELDFEWQYKNGVKFDE